MALKGNELRQRVLEIRSRDPEVKTSAIAQRLGISTRHVRKLLCSERAVSEAARRN